MADNTKIQWSQATWNVVTGCTRVSEECTNCYIERTPPFRMAHRKFDGPQIGATTGVLLHPQRLGLPLKWRKPRMVFVNSLSDMFHEQVPTEFIAKTFAVMSQTPRHTYQLLTKRPGRMRSLLSSEAFVEQVQQAIDAMFDDPDEQHIPDAGWPLPNVWVGVSAGSQKWADIRIPALLDTPAAVRWISAEPLLGPIDLHGPISERGDRRRLNYWIGTGRPFFPPGEPGSMMSGPISEKPTLDWVVCGGESGPGSRPMDLEWVRSIVGQCQDAKVPVFVKQLGAVWAKDARYGVRTVAAVGDSKGGECEYWPEDLRVREFPQTAGVVA